MADETRNLISSSESLIDKASDATAAQLAADASKLRGDKKGGAAPSTKQLVVDAEKLVGKRAPAPAAETPKSSSGLVAVVVVVLAAVAAAAWFLVGQK